MEQRIKFNYPRRVALIGLSRVPKGEEDKPSMIEIGKICEGWEIGFNPVTKQGTHPIVKAIQDILGPKLEGECTPFVASADISGCEVELIVRKRR